LENLKDKVIGVLMGGISAEREVSLRSGAAVQKALTGLGYNVRLIDLTSESVRSLSDEKLDVAFIALHGRFGEDGTVQGMLELLRLPYTGSSHVSSAVAMNKLFAKEIMKYNDIPVTPFVTFSIDEYIKRGYDDFISELPVVVKPMNEGSSVGISLVREVDELKHALELAFAYDDTILIEKYIKAREIQVGVLNNEALGVIEIIPKNEFYDFEAKYTDGGAEHVFPAKLDEKTYERAMALGLKAHMALGCSGASRVDFLLDEGGNFFLLEVNTLPGMTEVSLLPEIAAGVGIPFPELCERILKSARLNVKSTIQKGIQ
jgi:D-alanine-D-alanine ligase